MPGEGAWCSGSELFFPPERCTVAVGVERAAGALAHNSLDNRLLLVDCPAGTLEIDIALVPGPAFATAGLKNAVCSHLNPCSLGVPLHQAL